MAPEPKPNSSVQPIASPGCSHSPAALMGRIHDANGDWHIPLLAVALISLVMAICGALAGRDREIHP